MTKRSRSSASTEGNSWLATYSDMVTLLLAFFVMMFSFSSVDAEKFQQLLGSVQSALGVQLDVSLGGASLPPPEDMEELVVDARELLKKQDMEQLEGVRKTLQQSLGARLPHVQLELTAEERGLVLRLADNVLFDSGQAVLKLEARDILDVLAQELARFPNQVRVEGHTDDRPISTLRFPSNWELSTARATEVIRYLLTRNVLPPKRLSAAGYGPYRPVATNDTPEGRALNRRVDLIILRLSYSEGEPK